MKINIFNIPKENIESLKQKINAIAMASKKDSVVEGWKCTFYLSTQPEITDVAWVKDFETTVEGLSDLSNVMHYAIYLCVKNETCFALTYGKSHFYVRNFCDPDFGLEIARRIANENDVKQKAAKRFSGRKKKEIKSFIKNTKLDNESGESVDFIGAGIIEGRQKVFGEKAKFGASLSMSREDLTVAKIPRVLNAILEVLSEKAHFELPKTYEIKDPVLLKKYKDQMLTQMKADISSIETEESSYDLIGTDFIFHTNEKYTFYLRRKRSEEISSLSHNALKTFIETKSINEKEIENIKVEIRNENNKTYSKLLYEMIEYMVPNENVVLQQGKWKQFNEEYIVQINDSVNSITRDVTEQHFQEVSTTEPIFNKSEELKKEGYQEADADFSKISISGKYTIEAWDLQKDSTVFAVKFGTTQKLVYVCSQAMTTLDIIRNNANLKKLENPPKRYCLWLGFQRSNIPTKISDVNSIILKQHIDMFARKCREIGIEPVLKFSKKIKAGTNEN